MTLPPRLHVKPQITAIRAITANAWFSHVRVMDAECPEIQFAPPKFVSSWGQYLNPHPVPRVHWLIFWQLAPRGNSGVSWGRHSEFYAGDAGRLLFPISFPTLCVKLFLLHVVWLRCNTKRVIKDIQLQSTTLKSLISNGITLLHNNVNHVTWS